jgi:DNA-binding SARP family transcriptional activator
MSRLAVHLLGTFQALRAGQPMDGLDARKVQELFSYLLLYRDRPHPREVLADLLWGESTTAQSRKYLRQALWQLQTALDSETVLLVEADRVSINSRCDLSLDVAVLDDALNLVRGQRGTEMTSDQAAALEAAVALYAGDLLEGWYQDWCLYERERLQDVYLAVVDKLMGYCEANGAYESGIGHGARILRLDRAREHTHRCLMRLHYLAGDRTAALRQFERCAQALREELGIEPSARTVALYAEIRGGRHESDLVGPPPLTPPPELAPMPDILNHLHRLQATLTDMQQQLQREIRAVEQTLQRRH